MKRSAPDLAAGTRFLAVAAAVVLAQALQQVIDPAEHFGDGPPSKSQQQDAAGIGAPLDQLGDAVDQRRGLAGPGAGDDQQWAVAVRDGLPLLVVESLQDEAGHGRLRRSGDHAIEFYLN